MLDLIFKRRGKTKKVVAMTRAVESPPKVDVPPLDILPFSYDVEDPSGRYWRVGCELVNPALTLAQAKQEAWDGPDPDETVAFVIVNFSHRQPQEVRSHGYVRFRATFTSPTEVVDKGVRTIIRRAVVYQLMWDLGQLLIDLGYEYALVPRADIITGTGKFDCSVMARPFHPMTTRSANHG